MPVSAKARREGVSTSTREPQESLTRLVEINALDFVVGPNHLYFVDSGERVETPQGPQRPGVLMRVPKAGGAKERIIEAMELFAPAPGAMALVGPYFYWLNRSPNQASDVLPQAWTGPKPQEARPPPEAEAKVEAQERYAAQLEAMLTEARKPWWRRLFSE